MGIEDRCRRNCRRKKTIIEDKLRANEAIKAHKLKIKFIQQGKNHENYY